MKLALVLSAILLFTFSNYVPSSLLSSPVAFSLFPGVECVEYGDFNPPASSSVWAISTDTQIEDRTIVVPLTINLSSGVEFRIIRSSLQFPNAGTSTAISCGGGSLIIEDSQITQMEAAAISCGNVTITGTTVRGNSPAGCTQCYNSNGINGSPITGRIFNSTIQNFFKSMYGRPENLIIEDSTYEQTSDSNALDGELQFDGGSSTAPLHSIIRRCKINVQIDSIELYSVSHFTIEDNTIANSAAGLHIGRGHDDAGDVEYITIRGNTFENNPSIAEYLRHTVFDGNTFKGSKSSLVCHHCFNITVRNNNFELKKSDAIIFQDSDMITIEDNNTFGKLSGASTFFLNWSLLLLLIVGIIMVFHSM